MKELTVRGVWLAFPLGVMLSLSPVLRTSAQMLNGDFEGGNTNFGSDYEFQGGKGVLPGLYGVHTNAQQFNSGYIAFGDHTSGSGYMMLVDGATVPGKVVWFQTVQTTPGTVYRFSGWATSAGPTSPAVLQFSINGHQVGTDFLLNTNAGHWQEFAALWNSGTNAAALLSITDTNLLYVGNDFALDDLSFTVYTNSPVPVSIYPAVELAWNSQSNQLYQVQYSTDLDPNLWSDLGAPIQGNGTVNQVLDSTRDGPKKYYRVLPLN